MNDWLVVSHAVAISGHVINTRTDAAVGGVQVKITDGPAEFMSMLDLQAATHGRSWECLKDRSDRKFSQQDGHFHFLDLPDGTYTLSAMLPEAGSRYGSNQISAVVSRDSLGHLIMTTVVLNLPPTTVQGKITDQSDGDPIVMARASISGSNETTFSNNQGDYQLIGLEAGNRIMLISARGYQSVSQTVYLTAAGADLTLNIAMVPSGL